MRTGLGAPNMGSVRGKHAEIFDELGLKCLEINLGHLNGVKSCGQYRWASSLSKLFENGLLVNFDVINTYEPLAFILMVINIHHSLSWISRVFDILVLDPV